MTDTIILSCITVLLSYTAKYKYFKYNLELTFILIILFLGFRYQFGNDYNSYLQGFIEINKYLNIDIFDKNLHFEPGWIVICRLFKYIGFEYLILFTTIINCFALYRIIKKYLTPKLYWLSIFIYVFNPDLMLIQASTIRQTLALSIFIFSTDYIYKNTFIYIFLILLASSIHSSAYLLLPLFIIRFIKLDRLNNCYLFIIYITCILFNHQISLFANNFFNDNFERYTIYENTIGELNSGLGLILSTIFFIVIIITKKKNIYRKESIVYNLSILYYLILPIGISIMMISRLNMYFQIFLIITIPISIQYIKINFIKYILIFMIISSTIYSYQSFFKSPIYSKHYTVYKTIFSKQK